MFYIYIYATGIFVTSLSLFPGLLLCFHIWKACMDFPMGWKILFLSFGVVSGYFLYGFAFILIAGALRYIFRLNPAEGEFSPHSSQARRWILANMLAMIFSNTFMDFVLLTPVARLFYLFMGAKIGRNVLINSRFCSDLGLLEIRDRAVIGGHATVIAHSFEGGRVILKRVIIGKGAVVGLNAVVLPGVEIGDGAVIAAGAVLPKNTRVKPGELYAGVPAELAEKAAND